MLTKVEIILLTIIFCSTIQEGINETVLDEEKVRFEVLENGSKGVGLFLCPQMDFPMGLNDVVYIKFSFNIISPFFKFLLYFFNLF